LKTGSRPLCGRIFGQKRGNTSRGATNCPKESARTTTHEGILAAEMGGQTWKTTGLTRGKIDVRGMRAQRVCKETTEQDL